MEFELRPWRMEDAETIARYANNPKVAANLRDAFPHPYTQRDAAAFIQSCLDADPAQCCFRAIAVNGETVGSISLSIGEDISSKSAELGYWLAEPYSGAGDYAGGSPADLRLCLPNLRPCAHLRRAVRL